MLVEVYDDGTATARVIENQEEHDAQMKRILDDGAKLLYTIEGETWEECMQTYYDNNGWGIYNPLE